MASEKTRLQKELLESTNPKRTDELRKLISKIEEQEQEDCQEDYLYFQNEDEPCPPSH